MNFGYRRGVFSAALVGVLLATSAAVYSDAGASGTSSSKALAKAAAQLKTWEARPTSIGNIAKDLLTKRPPTGKTVAIIFPTPSQLPVIMAAATRAANLLGWKVIDETTDGTPQGDLTAYQQALSQGATAIFAWGEDASVEASGLSQAKAAGVPVFWSNAGAAVTGANGDDIVAEVINNADTAALGTQQAYFDAVNNKGKASTLLTVAVPAFPTTTIEANKADSVLKQLCKSCRTQALNVQITDIGVNVPNFVVTAIEKNPDIKYVLMTFTPLVTGVEAALKAAGITGVTLTGAAPSPSDFSGMTSEGFSMMSTYDSNSAVWRLMDAYARYLVGDNPAVETDTPAPIQTIVPQNSLAQYAGTDGYSYKINYVSVFKKVWRIG